MNCVDPRIVQQFVIIGLAFSDAELVGHGIHFRLVTAANSHEIGVWMRLMDGDELGTKPEADDGNIKGLVAHSVYVRSHTLGCRWWVRSIRSKGCNPAIPGLSTPFRHKYRHNE